MKRYFVGLLSLFAICIAIQQPAVVPNQEIVLEFANQDVYKAEVHKAVAAIRRELLSLGVSNTKVFKNNQSGRLTISYYTDTDISYIQKILSDSKQVSFIHHSAVKDQKENHFPFENEWVDYTASIQKIEKSSGTKLLTLQWGVIEKEFLRIDPLPLKKIFGFQGVSSFLGAIPLNLQRNSINKRFLANKFLFVCLPETRAGPLS